MANLVLWLLLPALFGVMAVFVMLFGHKLIIRFGRLLGIGEKDSREKKDDA